MLIRVLENPEKFVHHKKLITKLIKLNMLMPDLQVSDKGGSISRDAEYYATEMNNVLRNLLKG